MSSVKPITAALVIAVACPWAGCSAAGDDARGSGDPDGGGDTDTGSDPSACDEEGDYDCVNGDYMVCQDGQWVLVEDCEEECYSTLGCVECYPGSTFCEGDLVMQCDLDGEGSVFVMDCAEYGTYCADGECYFSDPCEEALAYKSNIGCEYWAADLDNAENFIDNAAGHQFAVAVANIGDNGTAHVEAHINNAEQGEPLDLELVEQHDIEELDLYVFLLPRRDVDGENVTVKVDDGPQTWFSSRAFRITSDVPVVAYQFNTLDQAFSNDASLLIPTSGLGKDYLVIGYYPANPVDLVGSPKNRSYVTVLGVEEDTTVAVTPSFDILNGTGVEEVSPGVGIEAGTTQTFSLGPFDVLNLETVFMTLTSGAPDLTGTIVTSDKPITVFSGTDLAMIVFDTENDSCCAEHIEQQVIPSAAMGSEFAVSHSAKRSTGSPEPDFYRIMAYQTTSVTTSLPSPNDQFTLVAGEYREFFSTTGFSVEAGTEQDPGYLHVAQFLVVQSDCTPYSGDSSLLYVPAVDQRRGLYVFTTGQGFAHNYAVVSMRENTPAMIDGEDVSSVCEGPLSDGELDGVAYESWTCEIADGVHMVHSGPTPEDATVPIGVFVYGYYNAGSYAYPAGSDLRKINPVVVE